MDTLKDGMVSLSLIANLTWDRFLFVAMIAGALFAASYMIAA